MEEDQPAIYNSDSVVSYLCLFNQNSKDFHEESLTILEQKVIYGKLHSTYKKALHKALQNSSKSQQLIGLLQEFVEQDDDNEQSDSDESLQADNSDKENDDPQLKNPRKRREKGRPLGTKRFKSSHESYKLKIKHQRQCKKCGNVGHYQKNCKVCLVL